MTLPMVSILALAVPARGAPPHSEDRAIHGQFEQSALQTSPADTITWCHAVISHFSDNSTRFPFSFLDEIRTVVPPGCDIFVYDKSEQQPCAGTPADVPCEALVNVGREQHTYAHHIVRHYDALPSVLILTPSDVSRHNRRSTLRSMIASTRSSGAFECHTHHCALDWFGSCDFPAYTSGPTVPASPSRLGPWLRATIDGAGSTLPVAQLLCGLPACHWGIATTTRDQLRAHPRAVYERVAHALTVGNLPEASFYMEWAMSAVYGAASARTHAACPEVDWSSNATHDATMAREADNSTGFDPRSQPCRSLMRLGECDMDESAHPDPTPWVGMGHGGTRQLRHHL